MKKVVVILAIWFLFQPKIIYAQNNNSFITIVNPLRVAPYNQNPTDSIRSEYQQIQSRDFPATWLASYDLLHNLEDISLLKTFNPKQELGILMEISPQLAQDAQVQYHKSDSWHRAQSLFLVGYTQPDRIKLIDTVFKKFKDNFGFYPSSVGAWWVDSYSLEYMKNKYGITANLALADQFSTDSYQVWGSYWSTPFYPSKYHQGEPARTLESKLNLVNFEWAPRDPFNGYGNSLYSTQDYFTIHLPLDYFSNLVKLYSSPNKNEFGQITLGLEGDLPPASYQIQYSQWMDVVGQFQNQGTQVTNMKQFSDWYRVNFPKLSPPQVIDGEDLLRTPIKSIWYQSKDFRIGLTIDQLSNQTKIIDFRMYNSNFFDPYYSSPIKNIDLFENIPSLIDSQDNPQETITISNSPVVSIQGGSQDYNITFADKRSIELLPDKIILFNFTLENLTIYLKGSQLFQVLDNQNSITLVPTEKWLADVNGYPFIDYIIEKPNWLRQRRGVVELIVVLVAFVTGYIVLYKKIGKSIFRKLVLVFPVIIFLGGIYYYIFIINHRYFVNQSELEALNKLSYLPTGKVVVYDRECINCMFDTPFKPAVLANKRGYVSDITGKPVVYDSVIFSTSTRSEGRSHLKSLGAKYIYLVRYGDYHEDLPFSPGDYGVRKIYENATAQVWEVES